MRKFLSLVVCTMMAAAILVGVSSPGSAATRIAVRVGVTDPWPGEVVRLSGAVSPQGRVVELQKLRGKRWVRVSRTKARARGAFTFSVRAATTRTAYRVVAGKTKIKRKTYPTRQSSARYVQARPKVSLSLTPGVIRVAPVRVKSTVVLQRRVGSSWRNVRTTSLPASGLVEVAATDGSYYRAAVKAPGTTGWVYSSQARTTRTLAWKEEFSDASGLGTTWSHRDEGRRHGLRTCSTTSAKNADVASGVLRLKVTADPAPQQSPRDPRVDFGKCTSGTYLNGMVSTQFSRTFTTGVFAARVKFQAPQGMHGGFWLQSEGTPEIDVAEYYGDGRRDGGLSSLLHPRTGESVGGVLASAKALMQGRNSPSNGYHVYSVERTSAGYVFKIDGVQTMRTSSLRSDDAHFIVLSILASDWELERLDRGQLPKAFMDVDWVRVWQ